MTVKKVKGMKRDAYTIRIKDGKVAITSPSDIGLLYGAYRLLQLQAMNATGGDMEVKESPFHDIRLLNHWDNLDGNSELCDLDDISKAFAVYSPGAEWNGSAFTNADTGVKSEKFFLIYQDTYIMGNPGHYMGSTSVEVPEKYFTVK